jgi:hypothetical protein
MPFRNKLASTLCGLGCSLLVGSLQAQPSGAELVIEPFPRSEVAQKRVERNVEHGVVIGSIRRINNQLRAEREVRTTGDLLRISWLIPPGHDSSEALQHAKRQLLAREHAMLYFCEGRECGSSSIWANQVLGFSRLYGPEDGQAYVALRLDGEPQRDHAWGTRVPRHDRPSRSPDPPRSNAHSCAKTARCGCVQADPGYAGSWRYGVPDRPPAPRTTARPVRLPVAAPERFVPDGPVLADRMPPVRWRQTK